MAQYTVDLPCIADAYINNQYPDTNYGNATILKSSTFTEVGVPNRQEICLRFNHSSLRLRKKIVSVVLRIYATQSLYIPDASWISFLHMSSEWDENEITYNNRPSDIAGPARERIANPNITGSAYNNFTLYNKRSE